MSEVYISCDPRQSLGEHRKMVGMTEEEVKPKVTENDLLER